MPQPDFPARLTSQVAHRNRIGPGGIRSVGSGSIFNSKYAQARKELGSHENRRVVSRAIVCAGSLRVRSCKLLWKPAVLQLMVTSTTSFSEDESHFEDCNDVSDDSTDDDIDKITTMTCPNTTHHYSLVFCHRSLMGHARRKRIELNGTRDLVEFVWGKYGMMSTQFEFSIVYGKRRRTLNCRASNAKDYLQWTEVLRSAVTFQGNKCVTMNRSTQTSSNASSNSNSSIESFCNTSVVKEQQPVAPIASTPTPRLPTNAKTANVIAPPKTDIAEGSALRPVPADIAAAYGIGRRRKVKTVANPTGSHVQRQKQSKPSPNDAKRHQDSIPMTVQTVAKGITSHTENVKPLHDRQVTAFRPSSADRQRQRTSNTTRGIRSTRSTMQVRKTRLVDGTLSCTSSNSKSDHLLVLPASKMDERLKNAYVISPSSSIERQQFQSKNSRPVSKSDKTKDPCLHSCQSCHFNVDPCDFHDTNLTRVNGSQTREKSWATYVAVYIVGASGTSVHRICWYTGTSDTQVEMAIRMQLHLPQGIKFLLRDADADVVPVSSTLPNDHHFTLVLPEGLGFENVCTSIDGVTSGVINRTGLISVDDASVITQEQVTATSTSTAKRKRLEAEETISSQMARVSSVDCIITTTQLESMPPPRSLATIIAQFVETFTQPITNDDNVSFIPNAGRFALYALYCKVVRDMKFHPKREDVFYKMTSMHGKVDRQRVVRYYRCLAEDGEGTEFVQYKPQGKGVLLRRYREVDSMEQLTDIARSAPFVSWLKLDPNDVAALYVRFIQSFTPIVKSDFRAQAKEVRA
ncbi:unnamed protein product [Peronospora farinosa]|uniref:PH domain-containing protein n=1 Tax=Peronospora farinosa TaxID=134698 RepID=A0AAV0SS31_9STRA|nr:unnamed protein product [Peronospora farinosa]